MLPKPKGVRIFLDSSVVLAALFSPTGGSFRICKEASENKLSLYINKYVSSEVIEVLNRKYPHHAERFPILLKFAKIKTKSNLGSTTIEKYLSLIHPEDAPILAGAIETKTDFLVTLDRKDFMTKKIQDTALPVIIVTPKTFFQEYWDE